MSRVLWPLTIGVLVYLVADKVNHTISQQRQRYKLVYTVPIDHLAATKEAIFGAGAGVYDGGKYKYVSFEIPGKGQFMPVAEAGANPHTGTVDTLELVEELRVEILCVGKEVAKSAVDALKRSHPYETVAFEVFKIQNF